MIGRITSLDTIGPGHESEVTVELGLNVIKGNSSPNLRKYKDPTRRSNICQGLNGTKLYFKN